jgi:hypothetical protein
MTPYGDHARQHGVVSYEVGPESIDVEFTSGWIYHFSYANPGQLRVDRMKELAQSGKGLSTFISKHVKNRFESRRRSDAADQSDNSRS